MYNGHDYLSCIKIPPTKQVTINSTQKAEKTELIDFAAEHRVLISAANKAFGEGKWCHTVVSQNLDYVDTVGTKCCVGCVSFVNVRLENGTFHEDVGYHSAEESTKGLSIHKARIGSSVNALKRVLLSFGEKVEKEVQQLQKQSSSEQTSIVQKIAVQSLDNKQIQGKSNVSVPFIVPVSYLLQVKHKSPEPNSEQNTDSNRSLVVKSETADANQPQAVIKTQSPKITVPSSSDQTKIVMAVVQTTTADIKTESKSIQVLSAQEVQRMERKRKQMEKQMEFKKRMMEKGAVLNDNKPNPKN
ncbi:DNA repair protein RAD52 homolog isoform X2 [Linepithema humile]|uniref:DNA repair protein RAD52 homolog isoform X2 n=1 Tax=Linepithema humile TaxID=83485 RepID=UPI00351E5D7B